MTNTTSPSKSGITSAAAAECGLGGGSETELVVDLRDRNLAALLAWLLPGAGHAYQRRWGKSLLFFTCIMGTFSFGMYLGDCKVVYAAWGPDTESRRLPYLLQVGVGAPALPALIQANVASRPLGSFMAPPRSPTAEDGGYFDATTPDGETHSYKDELAMWNLAIDDFELGTVYTMIAGLLNVLAIYDAWGGPVWPVADDRRKKKPENEKKSGGPAPPDDPTGKPAGAEQVNDRAPANA